MCYYICVIALYRGKKMKFLVLRKISRFTQQCGELINILSSSKLLNRNDGRI